MGSCISKPEETSELTQYKYSYTKIETPRTPSSKDRVLALREGMEEYQCVNGGDICNCDCMHVKIAHDQIYDNIESIIELFWYYVACDHGLDMNEFEIFQTGIRNNPRIITAFCEKSKKQGSSHEILLDVVFGHNRTNFQNIYQWTLDTISKLITGQMNEEMIDMIHEGYCREYNIPKDVCKLCAMFSNMSLSDAKCQFLYTAPLTLDWDKTGNGPRNASNTLCNLLKITLEDNISKRNIWKCVLFRGFKDDYKSSEKYDNWYLWWLSDSGYEDELEAFVIEISHRTYRYTEMQTKESFGLNSMYGEKIWALSMNYSHDFYDNACATSSSEQSVIKYE